MKALTPFRCLLYGVRVFYLRCSNFQDLQRKAAGVVLEVKIQRWYFDDDYRHRFLIGKYSDAVPDEQDNVTVNSIDLREEWGENLFSVQKAELNNFLRRYQNTFHQERDATPYIEYYINTEDDPPVSVPPYKMSLAKKGYEKNLMIF
ncbi:hypothetical protein AVEN_141845-1 [Araneus ventricosus]|uniref:Uncharacterized protein n=1 Tax=Araneus ventricosus TaxID=182803 RepID=A0A4Y2IKI6_ARAVE|nr:hypothetical protein AVEN_141845-1 [Araneus ventricosus]